jgi:type II secretion system protein D
MSLYIERENGRRGVNAVTAAANERLNAIVINGNEQDMIELRALAKKLDSAEVAARQQIKWIELKSASASEVVRLLQSVLAGKPMGGGNGIGARQATKVQFLRDKLATQLKGQVGRAPTEADIDGAIKDQVTLTPDVRTNSVWITAPEPVVTLITEMITDIEESSAGSRKIEYYKLTNADARQMADLLRDTFNLKQQGNSLVLVPNRQQDTQAQNQVGPPGPDQPAAIETGTVTAVPDERQQLAIAVDARTNTLIVSGTQEYLDLVRKVVSELDNIEANERERRVYSLRNAKAKEIETTLRSYFKGEADLEKSNLSGQYAGSIMRRLEEEVTLVGDEKSNKLVISTSPRYMNAVLSIVDELDAAPPQVMIQVLLAEVTIDSTDTWGMDVSVGPFGGDGYRIGSTAAGVGVATALGVPNLSVSSSDFGILVRSLEEQGKLEILSNPQVMVNNNQNARIQVGENIAIVNGVERGTAGNSFADVIRQDVGIILNVVPSISTDGFVRMDIKPEISQLSEKTTQVSVDVTSPIITKRAVDTVVTVKDGQSVVIGGLIQTVEEKRRTKVPILADIPIIGLPFRTKKDMVTKTELLVILTPRVIPGSSNLSENAVRDVTEQAVDRLEDPSKIEDYLERIRQEVRRRQQQQTEGETAPTPVTPTPPSDAPTNPQPSPTPPEEHSVLIPNTTPANAARAREATLVSKPRTRRP